MKYFYPLLSLVTLASYAQAATYQQTDSISGTGFLNAFSHQAISDPTHGRVYVSSIGSQLVEYNSDRRFPQKETTSIKQLPLLKISHTRLETISSSARITRLFSALAVPDETLSVFKVTSNIQTTLRCTDNNE